MDNVAETHQRQAMQARELRSKHETEVIGLVKELGLTKSTIQVSGARLQLAQRRATAPPTWAFIEREVAAWASHTRVPTTQTQSLLQWLRDHRDVKESEYIKKMTGEPAKAGPPAS